MIATNPEHEHAEDQANEYFANEAKRARMKGMTDADLEVAKGSLKKWAEKTDLPEKKRRARLLTQMKKYSDSF